MPIALLLALLLSLAPFPEGAVTPEAWLPLELLPLILLGLAALRPEPLLAPWSRGERLAALGLLGLLATSLLTLVPLGPLLALISPASVSTTVPYVPEGLERSSTVALYPWRAHAKTLALLTSTVVFLGCARGLGTRRAARWLLGLFLAATALHALIGAAAQLQGTQLPWVTTRPGGRATGGYRSPNHFAALLALSCPLAFAQAGLGVPRRAGASQARRLWLLAPACGLVGVILSASRSGTLAFAVAALAYPLLLRPPGRAAASPGAPRWPALLLGGGAALAFALLVGLDPLTERLEGTNLGREASRLGFFRVALLTWLRFPLLGAGLHGQEQLTPEWLEFPLLISATHNDWLNLPADLGLLGLLAAGVGLAGWTLAGLRAWRDLPAGERRSLWAGASAATLALLVVSAVEFNLQIMANQWATAAAAGLALAAPRLDLAQARSAPPPAGRRSLLRVGLALLALAWAGALLRGGLALLDARRGADTALPLEERLAAYERAAERDASCASYPAEQGQLSFSAERYGEAARAFAEAVRREPRRGPHHEQLARALLAAGEVEAAEPHLHHARALRPFFPWNLIHVGRLWLWRGQLAPANPAAVDQALACFQAALRWWPSSLGEVLDAVSDRAPRVPLPRLLALIPAETPQAGRRTLAEHLARRGRLAEAAGALAPLLTVKPQPAAGDVEAWARLQLALGNPRAAVSAWRRAARAAPDAAARAALARAAGELLRRAGQAAEERALLDQLSGDWPRDPALWTLLGEARLRASEPLLAVRALERAGDLGEPVWLNLARAYEALGRASPAEDAYRRGLSIQAKPADQLALRLGLAALLERAGRAPDALEQLRAAARLAPDDARVRQALERLDRRR